MRVPVGQPGSVEAGDEWIWQQVGTDEFERTSKRTALVRTAGEVCLEVRRLRACATSHPTAQACA